MALSPGVGTLRTRLVIERPLEVADGAGGLTRSYVAGETIWSRIEPLGGDELLRADSIGQAVTYRITLRWRADLGASMRLRSGTRLFAIRAIWDPDERRRLLVCRCEEVKP